MPKCLKNAVTLEVTAFQRSRGLDRADAGTVPIIAMSANAFEEDIALAKDAGMNEHLAKPVDIRRMFEAMSRLARPMTSPLE